MKNMLHQSPLSAWQYMCKAGGIELDGRDEGLDKKIYLRLNPSALSFEEALSGASMDEFLSAFFAGIHPFVMIFRDILDFFEHADATKGQDQWVLQVDNVDIILAHFKDWIEIWTKVENVKLEVSALTQPGFWDLFRIIRKPKIDAQIQKSFRNEPLNLPKDVQDWVHAYNKGQYLSLPNSLLVTEFPKELHDTVLIAQAIIFILIRPKMTREELYDLLRKHRHGERDEWDLSIGFDFWQIIQNETDHFLRSLVVSLSACATLLEPKELKEISQELNEFLIQYPRIPVEMEIQITDFESIISLPIWKKRHELYSVWIATEIIKALDGHDIELHHNNGQIAFAFHETPIATIHSVTTPFTLISERRSQLSNPIGKGRTGAVQPDYGLWTAKSGQEICKMIVEVKHYKKVSKRNFVEAFVDYANAFDQADIYLVNHGPTGKTIEGVKTISTIITNRCFPIQFLTPLHAEARKKFADAIRECVGEPQRIMLTQNQGIVKFVVFDVSDSMKSLLDTAAVSRLTSYILGINDLRSLVAVDYKIIDYFPPTLTGFSNLLKSRGSYTDLRKAVETLLAHNSNVIIVTDDDGLGTLKGLNVVTHEYQKYAPKDVIVCVCIN